MTPDNAWVDELAAARRPGWSLDAPFYTDPAIFRYGLFTHGQFPSFVVGTEVATATQVTYSQ